MNVWGVLRIVARRWYIAGPVLVAGCVLAYMQGKKVLPTYVAQAYVTLQGPTAVSQTVPGSGGQTQTVQVNPLLNGGSGSLSGVTAQLVLVESGAAAQADAIKAGVLPSYTVATQARSSVMVIACSSTDRALALATVKFGINHLQKTLDASEQAFLNKPTERVTLQTLIAPEIVSAKASKMRIELVIAAAAAVVAIVLALLLEALVIGMRRRRDRKRGDAQELRARRSSPTADHRGDSSLDSPTASRFEPLDHHDLATHGYVTAPDAEAPVVPSPHD